MVDHRDKLIADISDYEEELKKKSLCECREIRIIENSSDDPIEGVSIIVTDEEDNHVVWFSGTTNEKGYIVDKDGNYPRFIISRQYKLLGTKEGHTSWNCVFYIDEAGYLGSL